MKDWTPEDHAYLRKETPKSGLHTEFRGRTMKDLAADVVAIADTGLRNRAIPDKNGYDESSFLLPLHEIIDRGYSPAERLLQRYETEWNKSVDPIYVEYAY